jgi:peptidoglycan/LPS O-acetylase OafA/YrhL
MKYQLYMHSAANPAIDRMMCELYNDAFDNKLHTQFGSMATGLLVAVMMTRANAGQWLRDHRWASVLGLVVSAGVVYAIVSPSPVGDSQALSSVVVGVYMTLFQPLFAAAMAFIVYLAVLRCGPTRNFFRFLEHRVWFPIAQLSYGVYLVHLLIIKLVYSTMPPADPSAPTVALMWLGFVVAALALAVPLFIFVEAPFMRLRAKRKQHGPATARAPQPRSPGACHACLSATDLCRPGPRRPRAHARGRRVQRRENDRLRRHRGAGVPQWCHAVRRRAPAMECR